MKNVLKTLTGIMLVFAMVVTTGINSNAAGIKTNDGVQAAEQTTEAVLCGNNVVECYNTCMGIMDGYKHKGKF